MALRRGRAINWPEVRFPRGPIAATVVAVGLMIAMSASAMTSTMASAAGRPAYMDAKLSTQARVNDLLGRMTLPEKIGQMVQIEVTQVTDTSNKCTSQGGFNLPNPVCEQKIFTDDNVGSILAGGTDIPIDTTGNGGTGNTGRDWANEYNTMQAYAIAHSRLHIPVIFGVDAVHGFGHPYQAPLFPQSIGMGATWDPSAAKTGGEVTADALRATGWNWDFAPVQDLSRDNRWGRTYETWAEEPALSAAMGAANVSGLQSAGSGNSLKVTATVKHFAGYSESINGHDRAEANTTYFRCFRFSGVLRCLCSVYARKSVSGWCEDMPGTRVSRREWRAVPRSAAPRGGAFLLPGGFPVLAGASRSRVRIR